jgi:hypothetical protein
MKRIGAIGLVWIVFSVPAFADDFDAVAKGIESHYGIRRMSPRLIGFASFLAKPAMWGSGVGGLKIAIFEITNRALEPSMRELDQVMLASLDPVWLPFVRVDSRKGGKAVVIYSIVMGKHMTMLIGSVECSGISLVQIRVDQKAFQDWKDSPKDQAKNAAHKH